MTKPKKSTELRARNVIIPIGLLILLVLVIVGTIDIGIQQGWNIPGIGSIGLSGGQTGSGGTGTYTSTYTYCGSGLNVVCTYTTTSNGIVTTATGIIMTGTTVITTTGGQSFIPVGQVAFNMQLEADYTDGTNSIISSVGSLPGLDLFQIGGKNVQDVTARTLVGFVSASPLPSTAVATITANVTLYNERTTLAVWRTYEYTTSFVDGGTTALVLLPDFTVTPQTVYSDVCSTLANGTITCSTVGGVAPASRRVDWSVQATVAISGLSVIPQTFTGSTVSSADFSTVISGCTNCGGNGTPSIPSTITNGGAIDNRGDTIQCPSGNCTPTNPTSVIPAVGGCIELLPLFCIVPSNTVGGPGITGTPEHISGRDGTQTDAHGGQTGGGARGGNANTGNAPGGAGREHLISLLPSYYVPLDLGNGGWMFLNPWAAVFFAVIYIAFAFAALMLVILWRRLGKH
jgi:hypothetical protein